MAEDLIASITSNLDDLGPHFARLNEKLEREIGRRRTLHEVFSGDSPAGPSLSDAENGFFPEEAGAVLGPEPGATGDVSVPPDSGTSCFDEGQESSRVTAPAGQASTRMETLRRLLGLDEFDVAVICLCLAVEVYPTYQLILAYLQDDIGKRQPTVDTALTVLADVVEERIALRRSFNASSPLVKHGLVLLSGDPCSPPGSLLTMSLSLDPGLVDYLLGIPGLDEQLLPVAQLWEGSQDWEAVALLLHVKERLEELPEQVQGLIGCGQSVHLMLVGPPGCGKRTAAQAISTSMGRALLVLDCGLVLESGRDFQALFRRAHREALLKNAVLYLRDVHLLDAQETGQACSGHTLAEMLGERHDLTIMAGESPWASPRPVVNATTLIVDIPPPGFEERRLLWRRFLLQHGSHLSDEEIDRLADGVHYTGSQIEAAVSSASARARWRSPHHPAISLDDLLAAGRYSMAPRSALRESGPQQGHSWDDLVLPEDRKRQLREICSCFQHMPLVYGEWGFGEKGAAGRGLNALFAGSSGTGKTMAAGIIAGALGMDLRRIELSGVVSKYVGETEKNLERLFQEAERSRQVLLFDEADALFGKRGEVRDSHDRYANMEVSYLLQKMEECRVIVILTTNLRSNMDEAFLRRLHFTVEFPFPDEGLRLEIWRRAFPASAPVHSNVDLAFMARQFRLAGGNIRNIARAAAFLAADDSGPIEMKHLILATRREYQKMGKLLSEQEFGPYLELATA